MANNGKAKIAAAVIIAICLSVVIFGVALNQGWVGQEQNIGPNPSPTPTSTSPASYQTLPTVFTINDVNAGSTMSGVTISVLDYSTLKTLYSGTSSAVGSWTPSNALTGNTQYYVKLSESSGFGYFPVTIPTTPSNGAYYVSLSYYSFAGENGWTQHVTDPSGVAILGGGTYDISSGTTFPVFTWTLGPPAANTGIQNTFDPVKGQNREVLMAVEITNNVTGTNRVAVTNLNSLYTTSSTDKYYGQTIAPAAITCVKNADGSFQSNGVFSGSINFDCSAMLVTDKVNVAISVMGFDSWSWFNSHGSDLSNSVPLAMTFTFAIYGGGAE
jgi:hypothetical protein